MVLVLVFAIFISFVCLWHSLFSLSKFSFSISVVTFLFHSLWVMIFMVWKSVGSLYLFRVSLIDFPHPIFLSISVLSDLWIQCVWGGPFF